LRARAQIKNGTPQMRKHSLRQLTDKARELGAGPLFNAILPLLMSPTLEDQERHLLVKVIDRILYKLDDLVRPFVHKILVRIRACRASVPETGNLMRMGCLLLACVGGDRTHADR
jgi:splicing factor 3B subunit 1